MYKKSKVILISTLCQLGDIIAVPPLKIFLTKARTTRPLVHACVTGRKLLLLINIYFIWAKICANDSFILV